MYLLTLNLLLFYLKSECSEVQTDESIIVQKEENTASDIELIIQSDDVDSIEITNLIDQDDKDLENCQKIEIQAVKNQIIENSQAIEKLKIIKIKETLNNDLNQNPNDNLNKESDDELKIKTEQSIALNKEKQKKNFINFLKSNQRIKGLYLKYKVNSYEDLFRIIDQIVQINVSSYNVYENDKEIKEQFKKAYDNLLKEKFKGTLTVNAYNASELLNLNNVKSYYFYEFCKEVDSIIEESLIVYSEFLYAKEKYQELSDSSKIFEKDFEYANLLYLNKKITSNQFELSKIEYQKFKIDLLEIEFKVQQLINSLNLLFENKEYENFNLNDLLLYIIGVETNGCNSILEAERKKYAILNKKSYASFLKYLPQIEVSNIFDQENNNFALKASYNSSTIFGPFTSVLQSHSQYKHLQFLARKNKSDFDSYELQYKLLRQQEILYKDQINCRMQELHVMSEKFKNASGMNYEKISQYNKEIIQYKLKLKDIELEKHKIILKKLNLKGCFKQIFINYYKN